ncbi:unnamed protein product [Oppiella nova]|uniref:Uncharacterized protein n=1 Tax=Oppiella nova TaxID=334625 RepID=A0A7R9QG81_9ACAR|nr:unnamed protein product [Oppiella nova]CAG2165289.1 unnamed protein product [Oppiella nova]
MNSMNLWEIVIPDQLKHDSQVIESCMNKMEKRCYDYIEIKHGPDDYYYCSKLYDLFDCYEQNYKSVCDYWEYKEFEQANWRQVNLIIRSFWSSTTYNQLYEV